MEYRAKKLTKFEALLASELFPPVTTPADFNIPMGERATPHNRGRDMSGVGLFERAVKKQMLATFLRRSRQTH
jgi:hypothetical protein